MIAVYPSFCQFNLGYFEIIYSDSFQIQFHMQNFRYYIYNIKFLSTFVSKTIISNNLQLSRIILNNDQMNYVFREIFLYEIIHEINKQKNKFGLTKIYYNISRNVLAKNVNQNALLMFLTYYLVDNQLKMNLLINGCKWKTLQSKQKLNIYKFVYDLTCIFKSISNIKYKMFTFGYIFKPLITTINCEYTKFKKKSFYLMNTNNKPLLPSMKKYIRKNKLHLGIDIYCSVITNNMEKYIMQYLVSDFENKCYIQEKTPTRIKLTYGFNYVFYNSFFKHNPVQWKKEKKIANGIRYDEHRSKIPDYFNSIIMYLKKKNIIPKKQNINQVSVIRYYNDNNAEYIFESIGCHNERNKFDYVCGLYLGKNSTLSVNLKWNKVHGEYCIDLPIRSCAVFDSMYNVFCIFGFYEKI